MTASQHREELHALSDGAALLGSVICAVIGLIWAVAGKDTGMVLAGSILVVASASRRLFDRPVQGQGPARG